MDTRMTTKVVTGCALLALGSLGCMGQVSSPSNTPPSVTGGAGTGGGSGSPPKPGDPKPVVLMPGDFAVPASNILVLPFSVRLQKVAAVVGVPVEDPLLASLRDNRASLGDYDFANNLQPDKTWTSLKIADWVRAIKPICASSQMKLRYSALPEKLPALVEAAYGRAATAEDTAAITASAAGLTTDAARYQTICIAMLSTLEFVAQ